MSSAIDQEIIAQTANSMFSITSDTTVFDASTIKEYMLRGFTIGVTGTAVKVCWQYPDISWRDTKYYNPILVNVFTAQQVYLYMTGGKDLRWLSPRVVYNKLVNRETITDLFGINNTLVLSIYNNIIAALISIGYDVRLANGVLYVSGMTIPDTSTSTNFNDIISDDPYNQITIGTDGKIYVAPITGGTPAW